MHESDTYQTINAPSEGYFRDRGSKFHAYAYPVFSEDDIKASLDDVRALHPKARHHCYAWRLGMDKLLYRANDDGEPGGSAGRPILGQIDSFELTCVLVIVVRYFGGTKLGVPGLINAYKVSTQDALQQAEIITRQRCAYYGLSFGYAEMNDVMNVIKKLDLTIEKQVFTEQPYLEIAIPAQAVEATLHRTKALLLNEHMEAVTPDTEVPGVSFELLRIG